MKKISELGITGKKLLIEGIAFLIAGVLLLIYGPSFPELMLRLFLTFLWARELWNFLFRWFSKAAAKDPLWLNVAKFFLYGFLAGNQFFISLPIAIVSFLMGLNEVMNAGISGVTYYIYVKDGIRPRFRLLIDTIWLSVVGIATLIALGGDGNLQMFFLSLYFVGLGITNIRDGWFFEAEVGKKVLRRRLRRGMPLVFAALIPRATLQKINDALELGEGETASEIYDRAKENAEPNLEMFIHVTKDGLSIFVIRDALFHLGTTIRIQNASLERWGRGFFLVPTVKNTLNFVNAKTIRPYWDMVSPCLRNNSQLSIRKSPN